MLGSLVALDTTVSQHLHVLAKPFFPHSLLLLLELSADFRFFFPLSLSLLLAPIPDPSPTQILRPLLSPLIFGLLLDLAVVGLIKLLFRRSRPLYNKKMSVAVSVDHFPIPSGHSSRVCFVASLLHLSAAALADALANLRSASPFVDRWIGADEVNAVRILVSVAWAWAVGTSVSMVLLGRHFVTDVFAGACLGVLEALVSFHLLRFQAGIPSLNCISLAKCFVVVGMLYTDSYGRTRVFIIQCLMEMTSDWRIASDCKLKDGSRLEQPAAVGKSLFSNGGSGSNTW